MNVRSPAHPVRSPQRDKVGLFSEDAPALLRNLVNDDVHRRDRGAVRPPTVRISVAIQLTGIGRSKLFELIRSGNVEPVKIGTAPLVTMAGLRRLMERG